MTNARLFSFSSSRAASAVAVLALAAALGVLVALAPGSVARAGSCPVCTSSAECTSFDDGGVAFCVQHDAPVGCGSLTTLCCPGQGCNTFSGRPSCEGSTCTVVEDLVDGGTAGTDAGSVGVDAGPSDVDAGAGDVDAGAVGVDAGPSGGGDAGGGGMDAGGTTPPSTTAGCGCTAAQPARGAGTLVVLGLVAVAAVLRRRR